MGEIKGETKEKTRAEKLRETGIKKYGSEEKWREAFRQFGAKADRTTPRGFAKIDAKKRTAISKKGAYARWGKKDP